MIEVVDIAVVKNYLMAYKNVGGKQRGHYTTTLRVTWHKTTHQFLSDRMVLHPLFPLDVKSVWPIYDLLLKKKKNNASNLKKKHTSRKYPRKLAKAVLTQNRACQYHCLTVCIIRIIMILFSTGRNVTELQHRNDNRTFKSNWWYKSYEK